MNKNAAFVILSLLAGGPALTAQAAVVAVDCSKKGNSIGAALAKLDRSVSNTLNVSGTCIENVIVSGHRDLTIAAAGTAAIEPADPTFDTVTVIGSSRVALDRLAISGGNIGVACDDRSVCVLRTVSITGGAQGGLALQKQSSADIQGSLITGSQGNGVGVFGASSVNIGPDAAGTQTTISNHRNSFSSAYGVFAQDGSFVRVDNASITGNNRGAGGDRGAVLKLLGTQINNNTNQGVLVRASSLQLSGSVSGNGGAGVSVLRLGYLVFSGQTDLTNNVGLSIFCEHVTSITNPTTFFNSQTGLYSTAPATLQAGRETNCPSSSL